MRRRSFLAVMGAGRLIRPAAGSALLTEIRNYSGCTPEFRAALDECLRTAGIAAVTRSEHGEVVCTAVFASIAERNLAWTRVNTLPSWPSIARGFRSYRFDLA